MGVDLNYISKYKTEIMGLSAILIIMGHSLARISMPLFIALPLDIFGNLAVDFFLVISGMSMYYSVRKNNTQTFSWLSWCFQKLIGVLVPYFLICVPMRILLIILRGEPLWNLIQFFSTYSWWISGNGDWFIIEILLLYIITPFLYKNRMPDKFRLIVCIVICFCFGFNSNSKLQYVQAIIARMPSYFIGVFVGNEIKHHYKIRHSTLILSIVISGLVFVFGTKYTDFIFNWVVALPFVLAISCILDIISKHKIVNIFKFMGKISLESYLFNVYLPNLFLFIKIQNEPLYNICNGIPFYFAVSVFGVFFSYVFHKTFETTRVNQSNQSLKSKG